MADTCPHAEVRILTHNLFTPFMGATDKEERLEDFAKQAAQFDILLCQELFMFSLGLFSSGWKHWMVERLKKEGFEYHVASPIPGAGQCSGLMIFSKFPLEKFNPVTDFVKYWNWRGIEAWTSKGALKAKVKVHPKLPPLICVVTHLNCGTGPEAASLLSCIAFAPTGTRMQQMSQLRSALLKKDSNYIICGDFNVCAINEPERYLKMRATLGDPHDLLLEEALAQLDEEPKSPECTNRPVTCPNIGKAQESLDYCWLRVPTAQELGKKKSASTAVWDYVAGSAKVEKLPVSDERWAVREGCLSDHFGVSVTLAARPP